ncbi:EVE domain-containing protein [Kineococcus sp. T13]|uniref:EVE domain-containing protein n=1 Tax=Kineococcus vitellinus TaxID=2696565 RepID=UPI001412B0D7|nr:EVE domain-containing protein [Kineococcus vitellinus]NAZ75608.1 EVE domain-containing protein [Kineococcus vitellinus]
MPNAWILQANPGKWDIFRWHEDGAAQQPLQWTVAVHLKDVAIGDDVVLWVSGREAGVYAMGKVTHPASALMMNTSAYWLQPPLAPTHNIGIKITETFFAAPIYRSRLQQDPLFASALILRMPGAANPMRLTGSHWAALQTHLPTPDPHPAAGPNAAVLTSRLLGAAPAPSEVLLPGGTPTKTYDEQQLLLEYQHFVGHDLAVISAVLPDGSKIVCDAYDHSTSTLIEAKASTARGDIRMAIGQLLDYRRHIAQPTHCALLVPERPSDDLLDLIATVGLQTIYRQGDSFHTMP